MQPELDLKLSMPIPICRFLFVRWGLSIASMYIVVGETGDTDREDLLVGIHKKVILKDVANVESSENKLQGHGKFHSRDSINHISSTSNIPTLEASNWTSILGKLETLGLVGNIEAKVLNIELVSQPVL